MLTPIPRAGQAFANNAALLPRPMQVRFGALFDDAPQVPYAGVAGVLTREFGRPPAGPGGVFEVFEERAAASASIAQVHRAKLRAEDGGGWVAVKIQKPDVSKQVEWDLGAFRAVMWLYEHWLFHLPVCFAVGTSLSLLHCFIRTHHAQTSSMTISAASWTLKQKLATHCAQPSSSQKSRASPTASTSPKYIPSSPPRRSWSLNG